MNIFKSDLFKKNLLSNWASSSFINLILGRVLYDSMMLTVGSFASTELSRRLLLITIPRLLTAFTKYVLNISATSLLQEIISSFWVLFPRKGFTVFRNCLLSVMFLVSKFSKKLFFPFEKD